VNPPAVWQQMLLVTPPHIRRHPLRYALAMLTIAVAVALFVSMRATQASLVDAFARHLDAMAGRATHTLQRTDAALRTDVLDRLDAIDGVQAVPVVQESAVLPAHRQSVMILGVDVTRDAKLRRHELVGEVQLDLPALLMKDNAVAIPRRQAERFGYSLGDTLTAAGPNGEVDLVVAGILEMTGVARALDGGVLIMRIDAAQRHFGRQGEIDRIDLAIAPPTDASKVRAALGPGYLIRESRAADPTFEYLYSQFQTVLVTVSLLASVIAAFIIYNTVSLSVVQRAREIGTLRALGASPSDVVGVLILEAALLGLVASIFGALGGWLIAEEAFRQTAANLRFMIELGTPKLVIPPDAWLLAPLVGVAAAVLGALGPARIAASLPPVAAMKPGEVELGGGRRRRAGAWAAVVLGAACWILVRHPRTDWLPTVVGLIAGLFAMALAGPQMLLWLAPLIRRGQQRVSHVPSLLALDNIVAFPSRTALTTIALAGSLSLVIAMASMTGSLERETMSWMNRVFAFDLTVQSNDMTSSAYSVGAFPPGLMDEALAMPTCDAAYGVRTLRLPLWLGDKTDEVMLIAFDTDVFHQGRVLRGLSRDPEADGRAAAAKQQGYIDVSSNLAHLHGVGPGDTITLQTPDGPRDFEIFSVSVDYTWFRGCIFMDRSVYRRFWHDDSLSYLDIRVRPGVDPADVQAQLTSAWSDRYGLFVYRTEQLKDHARRIMREWFALANLQLLLAVFVGGVGVANTLLASVLSQTRQIGLLRACGATLRQVRATLAIEAVVLGLISGVAGCVIGLSTVQFLVGPMNLKATGFDLPLHVPYGPMIGAVAAGVLIAIGAAILPLRAVRRVDIIAAIGYE